MSSLFWTGKFLGRTGTKLRNDIWKALYNLMDAQCMWKRRIYRYALMPKSIVAINWVHFLFNLRMDNSMPELETVFKLLMHLKYVIEFFLLQKPLQDLSLSQNTADVFCFISVCEKALPAERASRWKGYIFFWRQIFIKRPGGAIPSSTFSK